MKMTDKLNNDKEKIMNALEGRVEIGENDCGKPIYTTKGKEDIRKVVSETFDSVAYNLIEQVAWSKVYTEIIADLIEFESDDHKAKDQYVSKYITENYGMADVVAMHERFKCELAKEYIFDSDDNLEG